MHPNARSDPPTPFSPALRPAQEPIQPIDRLFALDGLAQTLPKCHWHLPPVYLYTTLLCTIGRASGTGVLPQYSHLPCTIIVYCLIVTAHWPRRQPIVNISFDLFFDGHIRPHGRFSIEMAVAGDSSFPKETGPDSMCLDMRLRVYKCHVR